MSFNSPVLNLSSTNRSSSSSTSSLNSSSSSIHSSEENRSLAPPIVPHNTSPSFLTNDYINNRSNNGPPSPSAAYNAFSNREIYRGVYHQDSVILTNSTIGGSINTAASKDSFGIYSNNNINDTTTTSTTKTASGFDLDYVIKGTGSISLSTNSSLPDSPSEPKGGYLEPMTHFGCDREPLLLFEDLKKILSDLFVDYEIIPNKFKIRCVSYSGEHRHGNSTKFIIRIFSWPNDTDGTDDEIDPSTAAELTEKDESEEEGRGYETEKLTKGKYAVEFQRREGDIFHFYEIFHATKDAISAIIPPNHLDNSSSGAYLSPYRATLKLTLSTPPPVPSSIINNEQLLSALKCLQQMVASDCVDVKIQATLALTDLTYNITNDTILNSLINAKIVDDLFKCFLCPSEEVSRAALTGLANIVKLREDIGERILKEGGILLKLKESSLSRTAEIVRETARIIDNLYQSVPNSINNTIIQDCLRILEGSKISKASDIAKKINQSKR